MRKLSLILSMRLQPSYKFAVSLCSFLLVLIRPIESIFAANGRRKRRQTYFILLIARLSTSPAIAVTIKKKVDDERARVQANDVRASGGLVRKQNASCSSSSRFALDAAAAAFTCVEKQRGRSGGSGGGGERG